MLLEFALLGLVNWLVTTILVESELTRPFRDWVADRHRRAANRWTDSLRRRHHRAEAVWFKLKYLAGCHLCTGTWVGLVMAALVPLHLGAPGATGRVLAGLAFKAIGHFTLEIVGRLKYRPPRVLPEITPLRQPPGTV